MLKLFLFVCFSAAVLVDSIPLDESAIEGRIIGGNDTYIGDAPYQVGVIEYDDLICGGFILTPRLVVTAAQCISERLFNILDVRAGSSSIRKGGVLVGVKNGYIHPKYNNVKEDYDIAVLELDTPLKINEKTIKPITLASKEPSVGALALVSGWGAFNNKDEPREALQSATLPIYNRTKCEEFYKTYNIPITARNICAGGNGKLTQMGDTGGPLVIKNEVVGVVSFRYKCNNKERPIIFTSIANPEITKFIKDIAKF